MKTCVIVSSMDVSPDMRRLVPPDAFIIGADAGWQRAVQIGLQPHLALGDFDSAGSLPQNINTLRLPAEKNDTDTHYAAKYAVEHGFENVVLLGATGGRLDHTVANLHTLLYLAQHGVKNKLADAHTRVYCMPPGTLSLQAHKGCYLSVFAAGGTAGGVVLAGVKYPLHNAVLTPAYPLGISNEFAAETATVTLAEGYLYVMVVQHDDL